MLPSEGPAAILTGRYGQKYQIQSQSVTPPGRGEALIQIDFSGVCHGDVYSRDGGGPAPSEPVRPLIGGHEGVGRIVELGDQDPGNAFKKGDVVGIAWRSSVCGECDACRVGRDNFCEKQVVTGMHRPGTYQRYITFATKQLVPIPTGVSLPQVCSVLCAGVTAFSSLRAMNPQPGQWCVITGAGGALGHLAVQYAKAFGLRVVAIDGGSEKDEFCTSLGADAYIDFIEEGRNLASRVKQETAGGADLVLVLSPHQSSYDDAGEYARFGAQIMAVGIGNCSMSLRPLLKKGLTIRSNQTGRIQDIIDALELSVAGKVTSKVEVLQLAQLNEALDRVKSGNVVGKLVVDLR